MYSTAATGAANEMEPLMTDLELDTALGTNPANDDQRAALLSAATIIDIRYPNPDHSAARANAFAGVIDVVLNGADLGEAGAAWAAARNAERRAMERLTGMIIANVAVPESHIASIAGVDRMTVRKALGKR